MIKFGQLPRLLQANYKKCRLLNFVLGAEDISNVEIGDVVEGGADGAGEELELVGGTVFDEAAKRDVAQLRGNGGGEERVSGRSAQDAVGGRGEVDGDAGRSREDGRRGGNGFTIGVEGLDEKILLSLDLKADGPKIICVEDNDRPDNTASPLRDHLAAQGYFPYYRAGVNILFVRNEYKPLLT